MSTLKYVIATAVLVSASTAMGQYAQVVETPPILEVSESEAIVYFVRSARMAGEIDFWAFVDDTLIGVTRATSYVVGKASAGEHVVWSRNGNVSALRIELEAGETYYFRQNVLISWPGGHVKLELMDTVKAKNVISRLQYKELTREGVEGGHEVLAANYEEAVDRANE